MINNNTRDVFIFLDFQSFWLSHSSNPFTKCDVYTQRVETCETMQMAMIHFEIKKTTSLMLRGNEACRKWKFFFSYTKHFHGRWANAWGECYVKIIAIENERRNISCTPTNLSDIHDTPSSHSAPSHLTMTLATCKIDGFVGRLCLSLSVSIECI